MTGPPGWTHRREAVPPGAQHGLDANRTCADRTVREVARALHAVARHLHVGDVLLEPSDDDLAHLRPRAGPSAVDG